MEDSITKKAQNQFKGLANLVGTLNLFKYPFLKKIPDYNHEIEGKTFVEAKQEITKIMDELLKSTKGDLYSEILKNLSTMSDSKQRTTYLTWSKNEVFQHCVNRYIKLKEVPEKKCDYKNIVMLSRNVEWEEIDQFKDEALVVYKSIISYFEEEVFDCIKSIIEDSTNNTPLENPIKLEGINQRILILHYSGLLNTLADELSMPLNGRKMSKLLGYILGENPESVRPYLSHIESDRPHKKNPKNKNSLTQVLKVFEDIENNELSQIVQSDLKKFL